MRDRERSPSLDKFAVWQREQPERYESDGIPPNMPGGASARMPRPVSATAGSPIPAPTYKIVSDGLKASIGSAAAGGGAQ